MLFKILRSYHYCVCMFQGVYYNIVHGSPFSSIFSFLFVRVDVLMIGAA